MVRTQYINRPARKPVPPKRHEGGYKEYIAKEKSGGGSSSKTVKPKTKEELFLKEVKEQNIVNDQGQIRQDRLNDYRRLYKQIVKDPGRLEAYRRAGIGPPQVGGGGVDASLRELQRLEDNYYTQQEKLQHTQTIISDQEFNKALAEKEKRELVQYVKLYGRASLTQNEKEVLASFKSPSNLSVQPTEEGGFSPYSSPEKKGFPPSSPYLIGPSYFGNQDIRQTRQDVGRNKSPFVSETQERSLSIDAYQEPEPSNQRDAVLSSEAFQEGTKELQRATTPGETIEAGVKSVTSGTDYIKYSFQAGAIAGVSNILYMVTHPLDVGASLIEGGGRFVANPGKVGGEFVKEEVGEFFVNPVKYGSENVVTLFLPGAVASKTGQVAVKVAKNIKKYRFDKFAEFKGTTYEYVPETTSYVEYNGRAVKVQEIGQTDLYGRIVKNPDALPSEPGPLKLPQSYYEELNTLKVLDEGVKKPTYEYQKFDQEPGQFVTRPTGADQVFNVEGLGVQTPLVQQSFNVYDRVTGKTYKDVPASQLPYLEGNVRFFDDAVKFAENQKAGPGEGLPRYDITGGRPPSSYLGEQSVLKNYELVQDKPNFNKPLGENIIDYNRGPVQEVKPGSQSNLIDYGITDPTAGPVLGDFLKMTETKYSGSKPVKNTATPLDINNLVFTTVPGASELAGLISRGVNKLETFSVKPRLKDPGASSRSVPYKPNTIEAKLKVYPNFASLVEVQKETPGYIESQIKEPGTVEDLTVSPVLISERVLALEKVQELKTEGVTEQDVYVIPALSHRYKLDQDLKQDLKQDIKQEQDIFIPVIQKPKPDGTLNVPGRPFKPIRPPTPYRPKDAPESGFKSIKGFVAVGKKGQVLSPVLSRQGALNYGAGIVDRSALRSFRLQEADRSPTQRDPIGGYNVNKFYRSKKGFYTEKTSFAIDTAGELGEITFKGLLTKKARGRNPFIGGGKRGIF